MMALASPLHPMPNNFIDTASINTLPILSADDSLKRSTQNTPHPPQLVAQLGGGGGGETGVGDDDDFFAGFNAVEDEAGVGSCPEDDLKSAWWWAFCTSVGAVNELNGSSPACVITNPLPPIAFSIPPHPLTRLNTNLALNG